MASQPRRVSSTRSCSGTRTVLTGSLRGMAGTPRRLHSPPPSVSPSLIRAPALERGLLLAADRDRQFRLRLSRQAHNREFGREYSTESAHRPLASTLSSHCHDVGRRETVPPTRRCVW